MKASDYISVFVLAAVGTLVAYFLMNAVLGDPAEKTVSFEYLGSVSSDLVMPDSEVFNAGAINPTVEVFVGSCIDQDQDGKIDDDELRDCGELKRIGDKETVSSDANNNGQDSGSLLDLIDNPEQNPDDEIGGDESNPSDLVQESTD